MSELDRFKNLNIILDITLPDVLETLNGVPDWKDLNLSDKQARTILTLLLHGFMVEGQGELLGTGMLHPLGRVVLLALCGSHSTEKSEAALKQLVTEARDMGWREADVLDFIHACSTFLRVTNTVAPMLVRLQQDLDRYGNEPEAAQA